jgi:hypothetical protein
MISSRIPGSVPARPRREWFSRLNREVCGGPIGWLATVAGRRRGRLRSTTFEGLKEVTGKSACATNAKSIEPSPNLPQNAKTARVWGPRGGLNNSAPAALGLGAGQRHSRGPLHPSKCKKRIRRGPRCCATRASRVKTCRRRGLLYPIKPEQGLIGAQPAVHGFKVLNAIIMPT